MSKAQPKKKAINRVIAEHHRVITKDDVARRAYALFLARGQGEGRDVEDWLEAERQLKAESMAPSVEIEPPIAADSPSTPPDSPSSNGEAIPRLDQDQESEPLLRDRVR